MLGKLSRFSNETQDALKQLACLGNSAEFELLRTVYEHSEEQLHDQLWDAVRAGLIVRSENSYSFLHDRVQEAAYALHFRATTLPDTFAHRQNSHREHPRKRDRKKRYLTSSIN